MSRLPVKFYENASDLISDIKRAQSMATGRTATIQGEVLTDREILNQMIVLAPDTFKYKEQLVKNAVGTARALSKFCDLAMKNLSDDAEEREKEALNSLSVEVDELRKIGLADSVVDQLFTAKSQVNNHKSVSKVINGFGEKLNTIMSKIVSRLEKITQANEDAVLLVRKNAKALNMNLEAVALLKKGQEIIKDNEDSVKALIPLMTRYCALNAAFVSIMMGPAAPRVQSSNESENHEDDYLEEDFSDQESEEDSLGEL